MTELPLVEDAFVVPETLVAHGLRLELLGPQHNEADHAAWMSSIAHIRSTPGFDQGWPPAAGMTLAQNREDLVGHAQRSRQRVDFAYSVIEIATGDVIGCVYFEPSPTGEQEVAASSWVTARASGAGHSADRDRGGVAARRVAVRGRPLPSRCGAADDSADPRTAGGVGIYGCWRHSSASRAYV